MQHTISTSVCETYGGIPYAYYPLGQHIVAAPGVCGGRPTFKYTRLEVSVVLDVLAAGWTVEQIVHEYVQSQLIPEAMAEAVRLAKEGLVTTATVVPEAERSPSDENVHRQRIMASVAAWYRGRVLSVTALRPGTLIADEAMPTILRRVSQPTFVTTSDQSGAACGAVSPLSRGYA